MNRIILLLPALAGGAILTSALVAERVATRVDGDVSVGRLKRNGPPVDALVTASMSDGGVQTARTDSSGTFSFAPMPEGPTTFTIVPTDTSLAPQTFVVVMGSVQENVIVVHAAPRAPVTDVDGFDLEPSASIRTQMGRPLQVQTRVRGANSRRVEPTVWVDGGIGSLTPSGQFLPRRVGQGTLRAELLGASKSTPVTVDP